MSIGVWQVVLVLLVFLLPVGVAFGAVHLNTRGNSMGRKGFALRVLALIVVVTVVGLALPEGLAAALVVLVIALASVAFVAYWAVDRLQDIGSVSKNKAIITAVPLIGLFYLIYLMVAEGVGAQAPTEVPRSEASAR